MSTNLIRPQDLIYQLWNQFFYPVQGILRPQNRNIGLMFQLRLDVENFGYEKDGNTNHPEWRRRYKRLITVVVTAGHRVYAASFEGHSQTILGSMQNPQRLTAEELAQFKNTCNHDSCWHEDGLRIFQDELSNAWEHCFSFMPDEHKPIPAAMHVFTVLNGFLGNDQVLRFVKIERAPHPDPKVRQDGYLDAIKAIHPVNFSIALNE